MIALIDGDIVVYQAASRAEKELDLGDDIIQLTGSKPETGRAIDHMVRDLKRLVKANRVLLAFTDDTNFRKEVYSDYKANRAGKRKPLTFAWGKAYAKRMYDSMTRPGLEADDILGIIATGTIKAFRGKKVVCSIDKDMRTFPCQLYNWKKPDEGVISIDEVTANYAFYEQILTGDSVDGYPGCPSIGPVRAEKIIDEHFEYWNHPDEPAGHSFNCAGAWREVVKVYEKAGKTEEDAVAQARCARILRASDYDFKNKVPILWVPPTGE